MQYWICKTPYSARIAIIALERPFKIGFRIAQWGARQCPILLVKARSLDFERGIETSEFDYLIILAGPGDGPQARRLRLEIQSRRVGTILIVVNSGGELDEYGGDWDAMFVCPSGRWDEPLPLFFAGRLVGFGDDELFEVFRGNTVIVHPADQHNLADLILYEGARDLVVHFSAVGLACSARSSFTLTEAERIFDQIQALVVPRKCLFSVGFGCRAASPLQIFNIQQGQSDPNGEGSMFRWA